MRRAFSVSFKAFRLLLAPALLGGLALGGTASAGEIIPVPTVTIYPGDIIRGGMLSDHDMPNGFAGSGSTVHERDSIIGKTARRTLLPGLPISVNAIGEPKVVSVGSQVRVVFNEGGLVISTYASALQAGGVGDIIPVRNTESGLVISGTIMRDGTVKVGNG